MGIVDTALGSANDFIDSINGGSSLGSSSKLNAPDVKTQNGQLLTKRFLTKADAYVTGYFFCTFDSLPPGFVDYMSQNYRGGWTSQKIIQVLSSQAHEIQLPSETLKTLTFSGVSGHNRTSPLFSQKGNQVTIQFLADQDMQLTSIISAWYEYITRVSDSRLNIEKYASQSIGGNSNPAATNMYGCNFYYATLLPNMRDVVFAFAAEGLFPTSNPFNDMGHSVGNHDVLKHSITFSIDYYDFWVKGKNTMTWIKTLLQNKINNIYGNGIFSDDGASGDTSGSSDDMQLKFKYEEEGNTSVFSEASKENSIAAKYKDPSLEERLHPPTDYDLQFKNSQADNSSKYGW